MSVFAWLDMVNKFLLLRNLVSTKETINWIPVQLYMNLVLVANNPPLIINMTALQAIVNWSSLVLCINLDWHGNDSKQKTTLGCKPISKRMVSAQVHVCRVSCFN